MKIRGIVLSGITLLVTFGISIYAISIPLNDEIFSKSLTEYIGNNSITNISTGDDIVVEEFGKIKRTVKKQVYKVKGMLKTKQDCQLYKYKKLENVIVGTVVNENQIIGNTVVTKKGVISGFDKEYFYVDAFENYYIEASCHPDSLYQAEQICKIINSSFEKYIANGDETLLKSYTLSSKFLTSQETFILTFDNLDIGYLPLKNEISIEYVFGDSIVGIAIEEKYVWGDENGKYLVTLNNQIIDITVTYVIDDLVFFNASNYLFNEKYRIRE